ncbi:MAG: RecX family transcriptional regulator [Muribaculaceae bacterium]|nr:RecX family transcriptional regulator [Muribaculaceae bacterium]
MQRKPLTTENALIRLESLCARSERCTFELETKLRTWGITGSEAEKIIDSLIDNRFVDNSRFARAFANDKVMFAGHGRLKIRMALISKRIERSIIDEALNEIDEEAYREKLRDILTAKARQITDVDTFEGRTKLFRFGASRGFEPALVSEMVKAMFRKR